MSELAAALPVDEPDAPQRRKIDVAANASDAPRLQAEALQSAIFNSAMFSKIATDAQGVIQIFNVGAEHMLGYAAVDVMNKITPADISDPNELVVRAKALSRELGTEIAPGFEALVFKASRGIEDIYELTYVRKDGSRFPAIVSVTALRDAHQAIIGYLLIGTDNTARMRAEQTQRDMNEELARAKIAAETANLAKSDFLSSMSHELRSPLNAILGFAQLIDSGSPAPTPDQKESIDQILQSGWYLLELINEILDLSLIESGNVSLSLEAISVAEILADCRAMVEPQAKAAGIALQFPAAVSLYCVRADATRLKQIFVNLLSNAIKYNCAGGSVKVDLSRLADDRIRIEFRDTGPGLSPDHLLQLFQAFNRLGQETGHKEGTGIGLVVSKRLAELMGGAIGVESEVGVGSVFWVELASTEFDSLSIDSTEVLLPSTPDVDATSPRRTVLYVEDNTANLMLISKLVARRGDLQLMTAGNGNQGVELARAAMPAVIVMDINLPGMSGFMALRILAEDPVTAGIPVIALSANAMPRDVEKGLAAGFFRYLTKPIKVDEFMRTLDAALELSTERNPIVNQATQ